MGKLTATSRLGAISGVESGALDFRAREALLTIINNNDYFPRVVVILLLVIILVGLAWARIGDKSTRKITTPYICAENAPESAINRRGCLFRAWNRQLVIETSKRPPTGLFNGNGENEMQESFTSRAHDEILRILKQNEYRCRKSYTNNSGMYVNLVRKHFEQMRYIEGLLNVCDSWHNYLPTAEELEESWPLIHKMTGIGIPEMFDNWRNANLKGLNLRSRKFYELLEMSRQSNWTQLQLHCMFILWYDERAKRVAENKLKPSPDQIALRKMQRERDRLVAQLAENQHRLDNLNKTISGYIQQHTEDEQSRD